MANSYTEGGLGAISNQIGWTDGRAPYLESKAWRYRATRRVLDAREYFISPLRKSYLLPSEVDYVLMTRHGPKLGGSYFKVNVDAMLKARNLKLIKTFHHKSIFLFKVERQES